MNEQRLPFDAFQTGQCPELESTLDEREDTYKRYRYFVQRIRFPKPKPFLIYLALNTAFKRTTDIYLNTK